MPFKTDRVHHLQFKNLIIWLPVKVYHSIYIMQDNFKTVSFDQGNTGDEKNDHFSGWKHLLCWFRAFWRKFYREKHFSGFKITKARWYFKDFYELLLSTGKYLAFYREPFFSHNPFISHKFRSSYYIIYYFIVTKALKYNTSKGFMLLHSADYY